LADSVPTRPLSSSPPPGDVVLTARASSIIPANAVPTRATLHPPPNAAPTRAAKLHDTVSFRAASHILPQAGPTRAANLNDTVPTRAASHSQNITSLLRPQCASGDTPSLHGTRDTHGMEPTLAFLRPRGLSPPVPRLLGGAPPPSESEMPPPLIHIFDVIRLGLPTDSLYSCTSSVACGSLRIFTPAYADPRSLRAAHTSGALLREVPVGDIEDFRRRAFNALPLRYNNVLASDLALEFDNSLPAAGARRGPSPSSTLPQIGESPSSSSTTGSPLHNCPAPALLVAPSPSTSPGSMSTCSTRPDSPSPTKAPCLSESVSPPRRTLGDDVDLDLW
jgi:hypothetical protein